MPLPREWTDVPVEANAVETLYRRLFDEPEAKLLPDEAKAIVREHLLPHAVRAARLARSHKQKYQRAGLAVYVLSPLAVATVALAVLTAPHGHMFYWPHFLILLVIVVVIWRTDRGRARRKWIEARFLAERLRSAAFLVSCGVAPVSPPVRTNDERAEWMTSAFAEIAAGLPPLPIGSPETCAVAAAYVRRHWLEDQIAFHRRTARRFRAVSHRLERAGLVIFCLALVAAAGHLALPYLAGEHAPAWIEGSLTFAALVLPGVGAAIGGFRAHCEDSRLAKRSERMVPALSALAAELDRASSPRQLEQVLGRIEQVTLAEAQDWLTVMQFVRLEAA